MSSLSSKVELGYDKDPSSSSMWDLVEMYSIKQITQMEECLDILERDTLIFYRNKFGLPFPLEF